MAVLIAEPARAASEPPLLDPFLSLCLATLPPVRPDDLWTSWSFAPQVVLPLLAVLAIYGRSLVALWRQDGRRGVPLGRAACFAAGWVSLVLALVSPLCRLAATLVSAHMVQHILLVAVAPPLLVLGMVSGMPGRGLPPGWRAAAGRWFGRAGATRLRRALRQPIVAGALYGAAVWMWHLPPLYEAVLVNAALHTVLYALLLAVAILYWRAVIGDMRPDQAGYRILSMLITLIHTGLLGALMTFAAEPWYPVLALRAGTWDLAPLADQQLAGLIMWVPMGAVYLFAVLALVSAWLMAIEQKGTAA